MTPHLCCASQMSYDYALSNAIFVIFFAYLVPVVLMFRNYLEIALFVWRKGRAIGNSLVPRAYNVTSFKLLKHRTKLVKLLVLVAMIFAMSWFPFFALLLYAVSIYSSWLSGR